MADTPFSRLSLATPYGSGSVSIPVDGIDTTVQGTNIGVKVARGANTGIKTLNNAEWLTPALRETLEKAGVVATIVEKPLMAAGGALEVGTGGYKIAKAKPGDERAVTVGANAPTMLGGAITTGGVIAEWTGIIAGGTTATILLPVTAVAAGTAFLIKDGMLTDHMHAHQSVMKTVNPDVVHQSNLKVIAESYDHAIASMKKKGEQTAQLELVHSSDGKVDLMNVTNQQKLGLFLQQQHELTQKALDDAQSGFFQMNVWPEGAKDIHKELASFAAEETLARLGAATGELSQLSDSVQYATVKGRTATQSRDDAVTGMRAPEVVVKNFTYTLEEGTRWTSDTFKSDNYKNEPLPKEAIAAFRADPEHNRIYKEVKYQKDASGNPVLDKHHQPVVAEVKRWEILVHGKERQSELGMTSAEQESAFGAYWKGERHAEAKYNSTQSKAEFDKLRLSYGNSGKQNQEEALVNAYQKYHDSLQVMVDNAGAMGIDASGVKEIRKEMAHAASDFNHTFDAQIAAMHQADASPQHNLPASQPAQGSQPAKGR